MHIECNKLILPVLRLFKYIMLCSFSSVAAQLLPLALHKHDEEFISPEPILNKLQYSMFIQSSEETDSQFYEKSKRR